MTTDRKVAEILKAKQVTDGAGVKINRIFGYYEVPKFDPFLMLDHFKSDNPNDFMAGFPWHPHRGIETVTYMLRGEVEHEDSLGNKGVIKKGDIQWMTAGSGIIHQEMPINRNEGIEGFQLWVNLPAKSKMRKPRYQDIQSKQIPELKLNEGVEVRILCGELNQVHGAVQEIEVNPFYFDVRMQKNSVFEIDTNPTHTIFAYIYKGEVIFSEDKKAVYLNVVRLTAGNKLSIHTLETDAGMVLIGGMPQNEPVAWQGPIVMNTQDELYTAFVEYRNGTFLK